MKKFTPDGQDVTGFDIVNDPIVYTAARRIDEPPVPDERVITGHSLLPLLEPKLSDDATFWGKPADLWVIRNKRASPVLDRATGKPVQVITNLLSLSPSGRSVVVTQYAERSPKLGKHTSLFLALPGRTFD